jgi:hypothetical protein
MASKEMKSKVFSLANRLASRMDRSEAFSRAWAIVKDGGLELAVKGVTIGNRQEALRRLAGYEPSQVRAFIVPEPENPADSNALAVMVGLQGGRGLFKLGYVPASLAQVVTAIGGQLPAFRVVSGTWGFSHNTTYGARVALAV